MTPVERAYNGDKRHMRPLDPADDGTGVEVGFTTSNPWPVVVFLLGLMALTGWIVWVLAR